ncbi:hypothetical protein DL765_009127 [Monosporascus sp. GIB2]|nr:hypothetical protein DL765_009127 [Monosporascus sp. GIB2]
MEKVLSASIRGNSNDLIALILEQNPKIAGDARNIETLSWSYDELTTPLAEAILIKNLPLVRRLEEAGALQCLGQGMQFDIALVSAAAVGDTEYVRKLLALRPRAELVAMAPALLRAIQNDHTDLALEFLDAAAGLSVKRASEDSQALIAATEKRNARLVHTILNSGVFNDRSTNLVAAIEAVVKWGNQSIIRYLITAFPRIDFPSLYTEALENEDRNAFESLLALRKPTREYLGDCLKIAIRKDDSSFYHYLIERGAVVSDMELALAARRRPAILRMLLDYIIHRHRRTATRGFGTQALLEAIEERMGNIECLDILLSSGLIDMDFLSKDISPLGKAISWERDYNSTKDLGFPIISRLLDHGCDVDSIVFYHATFSQTAILKAIEVGNKDLVEFFIDRGADIHQAPNFSVKRSPLQGAAKAGNLEIVRLLLEKGADVNTAPARRRGGTALQLAAISGNCSVVAELLAHGALLNIPPSRVKGRWPIEGAGERGRLTMIEYLWEANQNIFYPDPCETGFEEKHCRRAMELAAENGHMACRDLIAKLSGLPIMDT